ncbi:hypothetical protein Pelo_18010 [Pelomyxa schiedti]|nr:hypothetical protein Pelo_18010 [Pelomyxa schiedti]
MTTTPLSGRHPTTTTTREMAMSRAVAVSRVVWDSVVPWLVPEAASASWRDPAATAGMRLKHAVALCVVGEGLFPLRGLVRRALVRHSNKWHMALRAAAEAGSPSCVDWLVATRRTQRETEDNDELMEEEARGRERERGGEEGEGEGGGVINHQQQMEAAMRRRRRRRENKEFVCVLAGLCVGGHLEMAQRLVGGGCGCGAVSASVSCGGGAVRSREGIRNPVEGLSEGVE